MQGEEEQFPMVKCNQPQQYADLRKIIKYIPHLKSLLADKRHFIDLEDANAIIIKSSTQQNIHKAIKYGIWTTISSNLDMMKRLGQQYRTKGKQTFLFFGVSKSNYFLGVARLISSFIQGKFNYWVRNNKNQFDGYFKLEWLFVKDINIKKFKDLRDMQGASVDKCRDCSELPWQVSRQMLTIFCNTRFKKSIFEDFDHYDKSQQTQLRNPQNFMRQRVLGMPSGKDKSKMPSIPMPMPGFVPSPGIPGGVPGGIPGLPYGNPGGLMGISNNLMGQGQTGLMPMPMPMPMPMSMPMRNMFTQNPIHSKNKQETK